MMSFNKHHDVRTTLTLDEDVASRVKAEARRSGRPFKVVINELLRAGLSRSRTASRAEPFRVDPPDFGSLRPGLSLDNIAALLEEVEGPQRR